MQIQFSFFQLWDLIPTDQDQGKRKVLVFVNIALSLQKSLQLASSHNWCWFYPWAKRAPSCRPGRGRETLSGAGPGSPDFVYCSRRASSLSPSGGFQADATGLSLAQQRPAEASSLSSPSQSIFPSPRQVRPLLAPLSPAGRSAGSPQVEGSRCVGWERAWGRWGWGGEEAGAPGLGQWDSPPPPWTECPHRWSKAVDEEGLFHLALRLGSWTFMM